MTACKSGINLLSWVCVLLISSGSVDAAASFQSKASDSPAVRLEFHNITLSWSYSLGGAVRSASFTFVNVTSGSTVGIAQVSPGGSTDVAQGFKDRFLASIADSGANLTVLSVQRSDKGTYQFQISDDNFGFLFDTVDLEVQFKPENVQLSRTSDNQACPGSFLNFTCSVGTGNPQVYSYEFLRNDSVVGTYSSGKWIRMLSNSGVFTYKCQANNTVGAANSTTLTITVGEAPTIQPLLNETTTEGENLNLSCNAPGTPRPVVSWVRITTGQRFDGHVLALTNINKSQAGDYRCEASNDCGNESKTTTIHVKFKPTVTFKRCPTPVTEGHNATLYCNATGYPVPNFAWINASSGNIESPTKTLVITAITRSQRGIYICHASNEIGNGTQTCEIDVYYRPSSSSITTIPSNYTVLRGSNVSFTCTTDASPPANMYHFYFKGSLLESSSSGVFNRTVEDDGLFTCVPINAVGTGDNATVNFTVVVAPVVEINETAATVVEGESITLYCNATGKPHPTLTWTKDGNPRPLSNNSILNTGILNRNDTINNIIRYQCTASNGVESPATAVANITVHYRPSASTLTTMPTNTTVLRGVTVSLDCNTDANPAANMYFFYYEGRHIGNDASGVLNYPVQDDGVFTCVPINEVGEGDNATVSVVVVDAPFVEVNKTAATVVEGESITLYCNATGKPNPTLTWTKDGSLGALSYNAILNTGILNRNGTINNTIQYQCAASNGVESPATAVANVTVLYPPIIIKPSENETEEVYQSDVVCQAEGNPLPTYVWKNASGEVIANKSTFKAAKGGNFTCYATNNIATVFRSIFITITYYEIFVEMTLLVDDISQPAQDLTNKVVNEIDERYVNVPNYNRTEVIGYTLVTGTSHSLELSKGRVKVYIVVYLNNPVTTDEGLANLQSAVASGKLGEFEVSGPLKIIDRPATTPVVSTVESTAATAATSTTSSQKDGPPWPIIGGVIGAVVVVIIIIIVVAWWVQNRRKCRRKDTKIHNSESEVLQGQNGIEDGVHAQVNGGYGGRYADSGPPSANGTNQFVQPQPEQQQQQAAVTPPDYAVVDKSKKKNRDNNNGKENIPDYAVVDKSKKKKNKKAEAEDPYAEVEDRKKDKDKKTADPSTHDYAVVNKSKKKKKEEDENAYATVDKSKKSKKQKPKAPGEVLYADLDDFKPVQAPSMPTVSTSPEPLAPLKRPPSYQGTEYADITQFLTGNATLPEGQSTEMQPTYANAGGGQGAAANKENANTGGKGGGGGDAEPKETPM